MAIGKKSLDFTKCMNHPAEMAAMRDKWIGDTPVKQSCKKARKEQGTGIQLLSRSQMECIILLVMSPR